MTSKILNSSDVCKDEVMRYLARRYKCNPTDIVRRFLQQERFVNTTGKDDHPQTILEENEMEILRDMKIFPSKIELSTRNSLPSIIALPLFGNRQLISPVVAS